jgi:arylsulfatase A-like enzyme
MAGEKGKKRARLIFLAAILALLGSWLAYAYLEKQRQWSVAIVIIDTLPSGHAGAYGYHRATTPNLDRLCREAVRFERAVAPSPWTLPSMASILTGRYPHQHFAGWSVNPRSEEVRVLAKFRGDTPTMAVYFREMGYRTAGFFCNPFTHPTYGLDQGFHTYDYSPGDNSKIRKADQVVSDAVEWLSSGDGRPFFLVLHFFDPHLDYDPPPDLAEAFIGDYKGEMRAPFSPATLRPIRKGEELTDEDDREFVKSLYDAEVLGSDRALGAFIEHLKKAALYNRALLVVTSDHGEEFWEHGGFEHGHSLFREVVEVPLVIKFPGIASRLTGGRSVKKYVSLVDIFPTLAEFMGWPEPGGLAGMSLCPSLGMIYVPDRAVFSMNPLYGKDELVALYRNDYKIIVERERGDMMIFNLASDPREHNDLYGKVELPADIESRVNEIKAILADMKNQKLEPSQPDRETIEQLKSLGYVE